MAPRDMIDLLDETRMSDARFSGFLNSVANGLNSRDAALWWQNRVSTAAVAAPRPAASRGFGETLVDLNRGLVDFAQARHGGAAFDRTVQRVAGAARGLAGAATDIAILTTPGDPRFMGALDRTLARGAATVAGFGRSVGMVVAGAGGLADVAITGRGRVGQSAAYLVQGTIETGIVLAPSTRLMGTTKVGVAAETTGSRIIYDAPIGPVRPINKNSLSYVGDTHVYVIRGPDGAWKIGESAQGVRVDGMSIRGEAQARALAREKGGFYRSELRNGGNPFASKAEARAYETRFIETYRRLFGSGPNDKTLLPGNKTNR